MFLGKTVTGGKNHDFSLLKIEFPPKMNWFKNQNLVVDLGYQGIKKEYEAKQIAIPFKKPKKSKKNPEPKLTLQEREYNQSVGSQRIYVENALSGLKRFQKLCVKYRGKSVEKLDDSVEICAGLWNYKLDFKSK
jgi:hypothetical protein